MTGFKLDRMEIEEVGANPERLAAAIHEQLGDCSGPVPVQKIAYALDIVTIWSKPLFSVEGVLMTGRERDYGAIVVNASSSRQRQRFTLAHELGHFLNGWHVPTSPDGFWCDRSDMRANDTRSTDRHKRQEAEANEFAIELLAPKKRVQRFLRDIPDLEQVLEIAADLDISKQAATRRYVSLHDETIAAIFSSNGTFQYAEWSTGFPKLLCRKGDALPPLPPARNLVVVSDIEEADASEWLERPEGMELSVQTLHQQEGFATILLHASLLEAAD